MKNFTTKFIGTLALVFALGFSVNSQAQNNIDLPEGWSMFGYNCEEPQEVTSALNEIVDKIVIVKDYLGNAYFPELGYNGIADFTNGVGYQVKMTENVEGFEFCASVVPEDGITQTDVDAQAAFSYDSGYGAGLNSVDITTDNQDAYDQGAASVTPEDGITQVDVDAQADLSYGYGYGEGAASVTPEDGVSQADVDAVKTELTIALDSLSNLTEQMGEIVLSYNGEQVIYISEFVNSLLLDVNTLLDSDALDLNSLGELADNYLTPGIAYLTDNSLVTDAEVSLLYNILFDIAGLVANQEDGITQADVDAAILATEANYLGWCLSDLDNDGICDADEVSGCGDDTACNYNVLATDDNNSCIYASEGSDCD